MRPESQSLRATARRLFVSLSAIFRLYIGMFYISEDTVHFDRRKQGGKGIFRMWARTALKIPAPLYGARYCAEKALDRP